MFRVPVQHITAAQHNSDRATSLDGNCMCRVSKVQSFFTSGQLKVVSLFHYFVFHVLLTPHVKSYCKTVTMA